MTKLKLMTIVGTRPELIRLAPTIKACDKYFEHILVHTGQNFDYNLNQIFFEDLNLRQPDYYLDTVGADLGDTIGNIISKSYKIMIKENPDALLILGDTNSALSALSAKRLKIPIFHMEAGNRCWDWNVSEMINRKIIDHISDINLPYTEHARTNLISEGLDSKTIFVTGSPLPELFKNFMTKINSSSILEELNLEKNKYILLSAHREENIDNEDNFLNLMNSINTIAKEYKLPIIYSAHPRSLSFIKSRNFKFDPLVKVLKPFGFTDYNNLQINSFCVLSDSGTLSEESAILNFPAVLIRTSTEHPEVFDKGSLVIGGIKSNDIKQAIDLQVCMHQNNEEVLLCDSYLDSNVSVKIVKLIQSYTKIVNKVTWLKH